MSEARIDFETRSDVDLKTRGSGPYFASPHWRALMCAYRIDDGPIRTWTYDRPCPDDLRAHVEAGGTIRAWNASFERQCFEQLHARAGWPLPDIRQYRCTAAEAAAMSLPRKLEQAAEALGLSVQKDKRGAALIKKFSMPRRPRGGEQPGLWWNEPEDHPDDFRAFLEYCVRDVETEEAAARRLVPLSDYEQAVYVLDQTINRRGIRVDVASARAALALAEKAQTDLNREMRLVTGGYVGRCTEPGKLTAWVAAQGVPMTSATKGEITDLLEADDLPANVRRALEIRQEAAKTSVQKLAAMLARADEDGRVRGSFLYCGAGTGRWVSLGVNFANAPRPRKLYEDAKLDTGVLFDAIRVAEPQHLRDLYGDQLGRPLHLLSDAIRGFIWAAPGHELIQADYSNIEGNVIAWSANEEWKLAAIREIAADPEHVPDMYRRTAAAILGLPLDEVTKKHWARQAVGKPAELGLAYGGGVMAFVTFARNYGVKLDGIAGKVIEQADQERLERAEKRWRSQSQRGLSGTADLSREAWIACEVVKLGWRAQNAAIARSWQDLEAAVREAVEQPGTIAKAAKVSYLVARGFLWARLPSGRCLAYGAPRLKAQVWARVKLPDGSWSDAEVMERDAAHAGERKGEVKIDGPTSDKVTVLGVNSQTKQWIRYGLYGGLLAENNTQAIARDILVNGMFKAEAAGYPLIFHVYDELVAEVPHGFGSVAEFERIICELPEWADGLPLAASGWRGKRYRKD